MLIFRDFCSTHSDQNIHHANAPINCTTFLKIFSWEHIICPCSELSSICVQLKLICIPTCKYIAIFYSRLFQNTHHIYNHNF